MNIIHGNSLEKLKELEDNSVDSIVSDPPYGISFMGKKWDYDVPSVELWEEVYRVLKPGGHCLIACGTRTQHRMAVNLEDAGFEIRDIVAWVYGSGFPKSLNIGKAVDKIQGNEREKIGDCRRGNAVNTNFMSGGNNISKGSSPYEGWGTALKPAMELWTLCRKPLNEKTVAENVLKWGTGGINVDGCRVEGNYDNSGRNIRNEDYISNSKFLTALSKKGKKTRADSNAFGRFPANLIHDGSDEVVGLFPNSKGEIGRVGRKSAGNYEASNYKVGVVTETGFRDSGSASRFFYCAKASKSERNKGLEGFEEKQTIGGGGLTANLKEDGSYETASAGGKYGSIKAKQTNNHPTVKPIKLMQYLCKLITPVGGTVLDPFMGSGSTGIGAKLEGFDFIKIEREKEYVKIAEARINAWEPEKQKKLI